MQFKIDNNFAKIPRDRDQSMTDAVKVLLRQGALDMTLKEVSDIFCVSSRTLSRRLQEEGSNYRKIRNLVMGEKAKEYLIDKGFDISAVSCSMRYSDQSNFTKAFRRWTGFSPGEYVKQNRVNYL